MSIVLIMMVSGCSTRTSSSFRPDPISNGLLERPIPYTKLTRFSTGTQEDILEVTRKNTIYYKECVVRFDKLADAVEERDALIKKAAE